MDPTDQLVTQLGLLLTQTRFARRALEDVERATSAYGTLAFTSVLTASPKFGEPPMFDGALRVHVVNIGDLNSGGGIGDFLQGLLGGIGSFLGNLPGGFAGGVIGSISLVESVPKLLALSQSVERILLLIGTGSADAGGADKPPTNLVGMLADIGVAVDKLTGLFVAAGGDPDKAGKASNLPVTAEGAGWLRLLDSGSIVLAGISRVVDGLLLAIPVTVGALSWLLYRLGDLRLGIVETLRFLLRNVLVLRGAVLVTAFDTLATVARIGSMVVGTLASTFDGILSAVFDGVKESLLAAIELGAVLGDTLKLTIDSLLNWLVPTLDKALRDLGDLRVFRVLTHVVQILPAILPAIVELAHGKLTDKQTAALTTAAALPFLDALHPGAAGAAAPSGPDFQTLLFKDSNLPQRLSTAADRMKQVTADSLRIIKDNAQSGLGTLASRLSAAGAAEVARSDQNLSARFGSVRAQAKTLSGQLVVADSSTPESGLKDIATAYEKWLTGGGMTTLLGEITAYFKSEPGRAGLPSKLAAESAGPRQATVRIDEVVIEIGEPATPAGAPDDSSSWGPGDFPVPSDSEYLEQYARVRFNHNQRGGIRQSPRVL